MSSSTNSSSSFKEEVMLGKKQGIVSILGSAAAEQKANNKSLKRTLSADMSSKKWLSQNGFSSHLKRIASSEEFSVIVDSASSSSEIWSSIQQEKQKEESAPGQLDIWNSILTQKAQEEAKNPLPPPYIHPLIKRSSSLSEKSLEICTESLGSETGSDGFSSYPPSEIGDAEEDKGEEEEEEDDEKEKEERHANDYDMEDWEVAKNNTFLGSGIKELSARPFPPPLPSLSSRDGASLHMKPHRDNGRLVLEAISFPSQNNFKADRQDGRLVLSFINTPDEGAKKTKKEEKLFQVEVENSAEMNERGRGKERYIMEQPSKLCNDLINVHKLAFIMNKPMVLANKNPAWSKKFNEMIKFGEEMEQKVNPNPVAASLSPVARIIPVAQAVGSRASSLNTYECYWKSKPMGTAAGVTACLSPITKNSNNNYIVTKNERRKEIVVSGNKGDRFVFSLQKECKEPRRSLFSLESHCIATS